MVFLYDLTLEKKEMRRIANIARVENKKVKRLKKYMTVHVNLQIKFFFVQSFVAHTVHSLNAFICALYRLQIYCIYKRLQIVTARKWVLNGQRLMLAKNHCVFVSPFSLLAPPLLLSSALSLFFAVSLAYLQSPSHLLTCNSLSNIRLTDVRAHTIYILKKISQAHSP